MAVVLLPPGDNCLEVISNGVGSIVQAGDVHTAVVIPGTRSGRFIRGLEAATHRVNSFETVYRDVVTLFMGITGPK